MKKIRSLGITVFFVMLPAICAADAPHQLGGFVLGGKIEDFRDQIKPGTELPLRYAESLREVEVRKLPGFKTGLVYYGTCDLPSRIVRIEFKYSNASKKYYEELLKRFKKQLGKPDEWRGDPFHIEVGWKWKFVDKNNNEISLVLKHNTRDEEKKEGNSVKLTMWNLLNREIQCYQEKEASSAISAPDNDRPQESGNVDWDLLIPR